MRARGHASLPLFFPSPTKPNPFRLCLSPPQVGRGVVRRQGSDVCLLAYGSSVNEALAAADMLANAGVSATVVDAR